MAKKPIPQAISEKIVAEWRTGAYSQQCLADRHRISKGAVNKLCKGVEQDASAIVTAGVAYKQGLAAHNDQTVTAVTAVVDERTKHIQLFNNATAKNISLLMEKVDKSTSVYDHRLVQATIKDGKETVLGREPTVAVQINNTQTSESKPAATIEEIRDALQEFGHMV